MHSKVYTYVLLSTVNAKHTQLFFKILRNIFFSKNILLYPCILFKMDISNH